MEKEKVSWFSVIWDFLFIVYWHWCLYNIGTDLGEYIAEYVANPSEYTDFSVDMGFAILLIGIYCICITLVWTMIFKELRKLNKGDK